MPIANLLILEGRTAHGQAGADPCRNRCHRRHARSETESVRIIVHEVQKENGVSAGSARGNWANDRTA